MISRKYWVLLTVVIIVVGLDQVSKALVISRLAEEQSIPVISNFFNIVLRYNPGAAFSFMADADPAIRDKFFIIVPILTLVMIFVFFHKLEASQKFSIAGLSFIFAGAIGNLIDRIRIGHVTDFLDFHWAEIYHFPAFNVADSAINIGVALLLLTIFFEKSPKNT